MPGFMLESAVRATLIAICTAEVLDIFKVRAARVRHAVWTKVVVLMLSLPVWAAWGPRTVVLVMNPSAKSAMTAPATMTKAAQCYARVSASRLKQPKRPGPNLFRPLWRCLTSVYLLGSWILLARLAIGTARAQMLLRQAVNRSGRLTHESCAAPIAVGCLKPAVVLPEDWVRWTPGQLSAVLTHEEEHVRRRDPLVKWLALLNRAIFWFHPLAWWLERHLSALAEEACDAAVLADGHDPFAYSEYLLQIARQVQQRGTRMSTSGMAMSGNFLPRRIRLILENAPAPNLSRSRLLCVSVSCALLSAVFTAGAVQYARGQSDGQALGISKPEAMQLLLEKSGAIEPRFRQHETLLDGAGKASLTPQSNTAKVIDARENLVTANQQSGSPNRQRKPLDSSVIEEIKFRGLREVSEDRMRAMILSKAGDVLNEDGLHRDFVALWNTKRFEDIQIKKETGHRGGVIILITVTERP